jgi:spore germination protein KC
MKKSKILSVFIIISLMFTSGCWNYREISKVAIVAGVAIDKEDGMYKVTVEIAGPKGGQEGGSESLIYESSDKTIFGAIRQLVTEAGQKTYWSHTKVIIISHQIAEEGMANVLDFLYRDTETRRDMLVIVSMTHTAAEILKVNKSKDILVSYKLDTTIRSQKSIAKFPMTELREVVDNFKSEQSSIIVPVVLKDLQTEKNDNIPDVMGSAVLKKDKVIGYLNGDETKEVLMISNKLKGGLYEVSDILGFKSDISFEIFKNKTKRKAVIDDNDLKMKVNIKTDVSIGEIMETLDFKEKENLNSIEEEGEKRLKKDLMDTVEKIQREYKSDVFGFGEVIQRQKKKVWKEIEPKWEEVFSALPVEISVDFTIRGSGLTNKPTKSGGE